MCGQKLIGVAKPTQFSGFSRGEAAREAGLEESYSYWRDLYLREIQRSKEREREWDFKQKVLYLIIFGIFVVWFGKEVLRW
jgi:hypothetical protein